jgi:hypothetical protein
MSRTPVVSAATRARTTPATELRSVTAIAFMPVSAATANNSSGDEAPRMNEKWLVTWSSA